MNAAPSDESRVVWEKNFASRLPDLMRAIEEMLAFLDAHDVDPRTRYTAQLAAEEMGTNILKYGFDDAGEHRIGLRTVCDPDACRIELVDDGHAFNPWAMPEPDTTLALEQRKPGGLGICLVRQMLSRFDYARRDGRNILGMTIARDRPSPVPPGDA